MKKLVRLNKRPNYSGHGFTFFLRYRGEDGKRKWESLGHSNAKKAEQQRSVKEKQLRMGYHKPTAMTLRKFMQDSLTRTGDQIRESTRKEYRQAMEAFISTVGNIDYRIVNQGHGEYFRQACLDRGESPATAAKKLRELKRYFTLAVQRKQLVENPLEYVKLPKVPRQRIRVYSAEEIDSMIRAASSLQNPSVLEWDLLIILAITTGLRKSELLNLVWSDIDFDRMTVEVAPKDNTAETWQWKIKDTDRRVVPLTEDVSQLLIALQQRRPNGYPYVMVPPKRYDYIQQELRPLGKWTLSNARNKVINNFTKMLNEILAKARVKKGTFHDIRRSAITNWFQQGLSEYEVMTLAGHAKFETTRTFYLAVSNDLADRAREATAFRVSQAMLQRCSEAKQTASEKVVQIGADDEF